MLRCSCPGGAAPGGTSTKISPWICPMSSGGLFLACPSASTSVLALCSAGARLLAGLLSVFAQRGVSASALLSGSLRTALSSTETTMGLSPGWCSGRLPRSYASPGGERAQTVRHVGQVPVCSGGSLRLLLAMHLCDVIQLLRQVGWWVWGQPRYSSGSLLGGTLGSPNGSQMTQCAPAGVRVFGPQHACDSAAGSRRVDKLQ